MIKCIMINHLFTLSITQLIYSMSKMNKNWIYFQAKQTKIYIKKPNLAYKKAKISQSWHAKNQN